MLASRHATLFFNTIVEDMLLSVKLSEASLFRAHWDEKRDDGSLHSKRKLTESRKKTEESAMVMDDANNWGDGNDDGGGDEPLEENSSTALAKIFLSKLSWTTQVQTASPEV